jgi:hypothetical protein
MLYYCTQATEPVVFAFGFQRISGIPGFCGYKSEDELGGHSEISTTVKEIRLAFVSTLLYQHCLHVFEQ